MHQDVFQNLRRPEGLSAKFCAEFLVDFSASALLPTPSVGSRNVITNSWEGASYFICNVANEDIVGLPFGAIWMC